MILSPYDGPFPFCKLGQGNILLAPAGCAWFKIQKLLQSLEKDITNSNKATQNLTINETENSLNICDFVEQCQRNDKELSLSTN